MMSSGRKRSWQELEESDVEGFTERHCSPRNSLYISKSCGVGAWSKLNEQRLDGRLCDVILVADEGVKQCAHRCVLAASSEYFSRMFEQTGFIDCQKEEIELHGVSGEALVRILDFMYSGSLELTTENVHAVVSASDYLLFPATRQLCSSFMSRILDTEFASQEALKIMGTAERYNFDELQLLAREKIFRNFSEISQLQNFKELSLHELMHILNFDDYHVPEEDIWSAAIGWLEHDCEKRKGHLDEVMNCVRFPLMTTETLIDVVKSHELPQDSNHVKVLIEQAIQYKLFPMRQSKMQSPQTQPRGSIINGVFCMVGTESFYVYMMEIKTWYSLACPLPVQLLENDYANFSFNLVLAESKVYAIGKVRSSCETGRYVVKSVQTYDVKQNVWTEEGLPFYRENTLFIEHGKSLCACSRSGIELYCCSSKSWKVLCRQNFTPYDFVCTWKGHMRFFSLSYGFFIIVDAQNGNVKTERIQPYFSVGLVKGIAQVGKTKMLVTVKSSHGYTRKIFDMKTFQLRDAVPFQYADNQGRPHQEFPLCMDPSQFWHIETSKDAAWVMASHPSIMSKPGRDANALPNSVCDGVIPFFTLRSGQWERLPSIPERPGKPISLCVLRGTIGTSVACSY